MPVRQRYLLTKNNKMRLRYTVPSVITGVFVALAVMTSFSQNSQAVYHADMTTAALNPAQNDELSQHMQVIREYAAQNQDKILEDDQRIIEELDKTPMNPIAFLKAKHEMRQLKNQIKKEQAPENLAQENFARARSSSGIVLPPQTSSRPTLQTKTAKIGKGDTLAGVLNKNGIKLADAYEAIKSMSKHYDPKNIRPGQTVTISYAPERDEEGKPQMYSFAMAMTPFESVKVLKSPDGSFLADKVKAQVERKIYAHDATIELSLYGSGLKAGIPNSVIADAIYIYSWDVDFQRDIRKGDAIEVMYEQFETPKGEKVKTGDILYAMLDINGQDIAVYRYQKKNGDVDYYTEDGVSVRKALMKTPVDGARISSGYGKRKHPVLGYTKMHKGVDFAAPRGTPIYAAGDGTVEKAAYWSSYGNYIRIRHNSELKTAYAHLQKFAKGVRSGKRVKQGQVIGYIGSTGRSTGPHLHYEVIKNGSQVHPHKIDLPQGETLKGAELASFKAHASQLNRQYAELNDKPLRYASAE